MGNKKSFDPSQEENGPNKKSRIAGNYKNRFLALENVADMENKKNINPSQEEDDPNKKRRITGNNKNNLQPDTKTRTCCCSWFQLPLDVMADILSRLPSKSIAKVRHVCKQWLSLTYDPRFLKPHHERSPSYMVVDKCVLYGEIRLHYISTNGDGKIPTEISCKFNLGIKYYWLSNFVDGLTCAYGSIGPKTNVCLLNPTTHELQKLPKCYGRREIYKDVSLGLGIDITTGQYKIVRLFSHSRFGHVRCEIYTVGTKQWRSLGEAPFQYFHNYNPVLLHGALHWIAHAGDYQEQKIGLFRFNIKDEKFGSEISLPYPSSYTSLYDVLCLKESGGKLWLVFKNTVQSYFEIWTMHDYLNNTWVKKYKTHGSSLSSLHKVYDLKEIVGGDILFKCYEYGGCHIICYNPSSGALHKLLLGLQQGDFDFYRESLISPRKLSEVS